MQGVIMFAFDFAEGFVVEVIKGTVVTGERHGTFFRVKNDAESRAFETAGIAALAVPGNAFVAEIKGGDIDVRGFLIILEMVAIAAASDGLGSIDAEAPTGQVEGVDTVIADFTGAPMPEPMPIIMD